MITSAAVHMKGKRKYGYFISQDNGLNIYMALRSHREFYRDKNASLSTAMRKGQAGWAIDVETLIEARSKGVSVIVVAIRNTPDLYITHINNYLNGKHTKLINYSSRGGSLQRHLPLQWFEKVSGQISI